MKPSCAVIVAMEHVQVHRHFMNSHPANRPEQVRQALVLSGGWCASCVSGGLSASYSPSHSGIPPKNLAGVSAGAINAVHLAAYRGDWLEAVERLHSVVEPRNQQGLSR